MDLSTIVSYCRSSSTPSFLLSQEVQFIPMVPPLPNDFTLLPFIPAMVLSQGSSNRHPSFLLGRELQFIPMVPPLPNEFMSIPFIPATFILVSFAHLIVLLLPVSKLCTYCTLCSSCFSFSLKSPTNVYCLVRQFLMLWFFLFNFVLQNTRI